MRRQRDSGYLMMERHKNSVIEVDTKLLFVPLMFIFLRVWDVIDGIMFVYHPTPGYDNNHHWLQPLTVSN